MLWGTANFDRTAQLRCVDLLAGGGSRNSDRGFMEGLVHFLPSGENRSLKVVRCGSDSGLVVWPGDLCLVQAKVIVGVLRRSWDG